METSLRQPGEYQHSSAETAATETVQIEEEAGQDDAQNVGGEGDDGVYIYKETCLPFIFRTPLSSWLTNISRKYQALALVLNCLEWCC